MPIVSTLKVDLHQNLFNQSPEGYFLSDELFIQQITSENSSENIFTYNEPVIKEQFSHFKRL